ncbi:hypothetical protein [Enterobacter cloacae complex sp. 2022EL-00788]|uniref:hypothetical protein n=1 Tax=Enterobacter cloacae complex sp. 2022EL-00788 TaxID=2996512 RepID=UPI00226DC179|nr:hypothetical protein [Enterobacter cloacae complex sp. 2022EL-00788]MCY0774809.1 hypothetical protein [Enterobacter cloacae complex sp. 2022EL-00788]
MKQTPEYGSSRSMTPTKPLRHSTPGRTAKRQVSEAYRAFIRVMNELVEKYGTITDDEFFRVL